MPLKQKAQTAGSSRTVKWMSIIVAIVLGIATLLFLFAAPGGAVLPLTLGAALLLGDFAPAATCQESSD